MVQGAILTDKVDNPASGGSFRGNHQEGGDESKDAGGCSTEFRTSGAHHWICIIRIPLGFFTPYCAVYI